MSLAGEMRNPMRQIAVLSTPGTWEMPQAGAFFKIGQRLFITHLASLPKWPPSGRGTLARAKQRDLASAGRV